MKNQFLMLVLAIYTLQMTFHDSLQYATKVHWFNYIFSNFTCLRLVSLASRGAIISEPQFVK